MTLKKPNAALALVAARACASFAPTLPSEGSGAPGNAGACEAPWAVGETTRHALRVLRSLRSGARASRRSTAALFGPGPRFPQRAFAPPSASSWREVRSDLQVEPRVARVRHACRPRVPPPAPLSGCLRKAPFGEQDGPIKD